MRNVLHSLHKPPCALGYPGKAARVARSRQATADPDRNSALIEPVFGILKRHSATRHQRRMRLRCS
jgi:hypothetical protein